MLGRGLRTAWAWGSSLWLGCWEQGGLEPHSLFKAQQTVSDVVLSCERKTPELYQLWTGCRGVTMGAQEAAVFPFPVWVQSPRRAPCPAHSPRLPAACPILSLDLQGV